MQCGMGTRACPVIYAAEWVLDQLSLSLHFLLCLLRLFFLTKPLTSECLFGSAVACQTIRCQMNQLVRADGRMMICVAL